MKVLITGGSGLIGSQLTKKLQDNNIEVVHLTRIKNSKMGVKTYEWDWAKNKIEEDCLNDVTDIIHLAGAGIADKLWTTQRKKTIVKSRVLTARLLRNVIKERKHPLNSFISASGIGFYGARTTEIIFKENDERGQDFVSECCVQWEEEVSKFSELCRTVILRTGIVLSRNGGALEKISSPIRKGFGAPLGSGKQFMPWIHIEDMVNMYYQALTNIKFSGIYNAVAPSHVTNEEFTQIVAKVLEKKIRIKRVPAFVLKMMFSEMSDILLEGSRVDPSKIIKDGFEFQRPNLQSALEDILRTS